MASLTGTCGHPLSTCSKHHRNPDAANILRTSLFSKDQPNRIILYAGAFNPPHISHLQVLRHALESSPDLNIVAAIIYPREDDYLERKNQHSGRSLVLTNKKRASLWCSDSRLPAYTWVCDSPGIYAELKKDLIREARKDGLEICFVSLFGPDNWVVPHPPERDTFNANEFLISDAGRKADWCYDEGPPRTATGYTAWERVYPTTTRTKRQMEQDGKSGSKWGRPYAMEMLKATLCSLEPTAAESSPLESAASLTNSESSNNSSVSCDSASETPISSASDSDNDANNEDFAALKIYEDVIWESHLETDPEIKARFVSKRHHPKIKSCSDETSSTAISRIIANSSEENLREKLKDISLSPDLLFEYLEISKAKIRE